MPVGSSVERKYTDKKVCTESGINCILITETQDIDIEKEVGINVIEVKNLYDAMIYMQK